MTSAAKSLVNCGSGGSSTLTQPREEQDGAGWQALNPTGYGNPWGLPPVCHPADPVRQGGLLTQPDTGIRVRKR